MVDAAIICTSIEILMHILTTMKIVDNETFVLPRVFLSWIGNAAKLKKNRNFPIYFFLLSFIKI